MTTTTTTILRHPICLLLWTVLVLQLLQSAQSAATAAAHVSGQGPNAASSRIEESAVASSDAGEAKDDSWSSAQAAISYLQSEAASLTSSQHAIKEFLHSKHVPVGTTPRSMRKIDSEAAEKLIVGVSSKKHPIECRVSLDKAPIGSKCIAPCGCTGSQRWIQFAVLNRLRRKDPEQWKVCQTCQQRFDYSGLVKYGGVWGNALTLLLDKPALLRLASISAASLAFVTLSLDKLVVRFALSKYFWSTYKHWSKVLQFNLFLKIWGARVLGQYAAQYYGKLEKSLVLYLTELETQLIEPHLPVSEDI